MIVVACAQLWCAKSSSSLNWLELRQECYLYNQVAGVIPCGRRFSVALRQISKLHYSVYLTYFYSHVQSPPYPERRAVIEHDKRITGKISTKF